MERAVQPVIGLTAWTRALRAAAKDRSVDTVPRAYVTALEAAGAVPVLLPTPGDPSRVAPYLRLVDGVLLTGGDDVHPRHFGEPPHPKIDLVDERRDAFEIALVRAARDAGVPVFGVCRGVQLMNVALGGDIFQDIPSQTESPVCHVQRTLDDGPWHEVDVAPGSLLGRLFGGGRAMVNSFHHQACRRLGEGLAACARTVGDGLIEAVEDPSAVFFLGVQWHAELAAAAGDAPSQALFAGFVAAARDSGAGASNLRRTSVSGG
jgi:putative glutamine amidotransferase